MQHYLEFMLFAFSAMVSPGPNNLMLMHSGLNFGIKRTLPQFVGSTIGLIFMMTLIAAGLGILFEKVPNIKVVIKVLGTLYMLFLACKISQMNENKTNAQLSAPLTVLKAFGFQMVNPKLWVICITFFGVFQMNAHFWLNSLLLIISIVIITIPSAFIWMSFGKVIEKIIKTTRHRKILNLSLAFSLAATVVLLWI